MRIPSPFLFAIAASSLAAASPASAKPVCGNNVAQGPEDCDGTDLRSETCLDYGFTGGTLACDSACHIDTTGCTSTSAAVCGDAVVEEAEECDGVADAACPGRCSDRCACPALPPQGTFELHMIDVGQGDALLLVSPEGFVTLFDAGTEGAAADVWSYLNLLGIDAVDYTVVSHMHADHLGGMDVLLQQFPTVVAAFDSGSTATTNEYSEYAAEAGTRRTTLTAGETLDMGPGITVDVLHGDMGSGNENDNSLVLRVTHQGVRFLLGGDCEAACEAQLNTGPIDVYKVHHHGSNTSTSEALVSAMKPYDALISSGQGNSYAHPHQETLDRLAAYQVDVHRTDLDGDLAVVSSGAAYTVNGQPICTGGETRTCGATDVGECALGTRDCVAGYWGACLGEIGPTTEICDNGLDDDCDGAVDGADGDCGQSTGILIVQVAYDTPGTDSLEEFVDLFNTTAGDVDLGGWQLADPAGVWTIPTGTTIVAGGFLSIAKDQGGFSALYGIDPDVSGMSLSLNNTGDELALLDAVGAEADYVAWESYNPAWPITAGIGDAIERTDPGVDIDGVSDWSVLSPASPLGGSGEPPPPDDCGNGVCDSGEDCESCAQDCVGKLNGNPSGRYCCGNGVCEPTGEDAGICAIDCG